MVVGGGVRCGVSWKGVALPLGRTVAFAVETWARKGRRIADGKREGWKED